MNDPSIIPPTDEEAPMTEAALPSSMTQLERLIRRHPLGAAMAAVGLGCAIGVISREWLSPPPSPKQRAVQLLEDIQNQLMELAHPAYDRASDLADEGISSLKRGMQSVSGSTLGCRLRGLFS